MERVDFYCIYSCCIYFAENMTAFEGNLINYYSSFQMSVCNSLIDVCYQRKAMLVRCRGPSEDEIDIVTYVT